MPERSSGMTLDQIREALRSLSPEDLQKVLAEFLAGAPPQGADPQVVPTEKTALDVAEGVIAERRELLRRLALR
jgi:DNA-binding transcriptional MerR regulator